MRPRAALGGCGCGLGLGFGALLGDFALELDRVLGKLRLVGLDEEIVEAAAMLDRTQAPPRVTRRRTERSSISEVSVTWTRLGKKRVRVLRLEWLTLLPD